MRNLSSTLLPVVLSGFLASACSGPYEVTLNNQPVYTPEPLFGDYVIADAALKTCVQQTIADKKVTRVEQLTQLDCSDAGITSLEGLQRFLSLGEVDLSNNQISDASTLAAFKQLTYLNLRGNAALVCDSLQAVQVNGTQNIPPHCFER